MAESSTLPGPRILVVDDERDIAESMAEWLAVAMPACAVRVAFDGAAALEAAKAWPPDILVTDLRMPRLDGIQLAQRLQATQPGVRCVLITGFPGADVDQRAREAGIERILRKPIDPSALQRVLEARHA